MHYIKQDSHSKIGFVYKWTQQSTGKWYIGSRSGNLNDGYICSSKIVKPLILSNPNDWIREIISLHTPNEVRRAEGKLLKLLNAKNDPMSYNQSNLGGANNGGRKKGISKKLTYNHLDQALFDIIGKTWMEEIMLTYIQLKNNNDIHVSKYEKIFKKHNIIVKTYNNEVIYDGRI